MTNIKPIKLPFALNGNNSLIHITDVERGKKSNYICPSCKSPLVAVKGKKNQHHFRHDLTKECEGGLESAIHLAAKKIIIEKKEITLPKHIFSVSGRDSRGMEHKVKKTIALDGIVVDFDSVKEEIYLPGIRADIIGKKKDKKLIIEIFYRHKVDEKKLEKIKKANTSAIEIDLSRLKPEDIMDWETFWSYINDPQNIKWLHNTKNNNIQLNLEKKLAEKIHEHEKKYKYEDIEKERQENREKRFLLQALDDLETLSSKKHLEQLKREIKTHPAYKYYIQNPSYNMFSWDELPNFLNAGVPNGDWIYGCDRSVWQTAFCSNFMHEEEKILNIKEVDDWLRNTVGCKVPPCVGRLAIYGKKYPQLVPNNKHTTKISSWETLRTYCNYLCKLGMLKFIYGSWDYPGDCDFRVINKKPRSSQH